ncbi:MAG: hypothetical protein ACI90V_013272, partial [Bacillariaceae sp.]
YKIIENIASCSYYIAIINQSNKHFGIPNKFYYPSTNQP